MTDQRLREEIEQAIEQTLQEVFDGSPVGTMLVLGHGAFLRKLLRQFAESPELSALLRRRSGEMER